MDLELGSNFNVGFFLQKYGWDFNCIDDCTWETGWSSGSRTFDLKITVNQTCVRLNVEPLLSHEIDIQYWSGRIMSLNYDLRLCKISISPTGFLSLSSELMIEQLNYRSFAHVLEILGYYSVELIHVFSAPDRQH